MKGKTIILLSVIFSSIFLFTSAETILPLNNFPNPALGSYFVTSAPLPDGTFLIWDGNTIYKQSLPFRDIYQIIAQGYIGDPAFIAIHPSNEFVVLGQGFLGNLYLLDLNNPQNFTPSQIVGNLSHYYGVFLNDNLLMLDVAKPDFSGSEIHILEINTKSKRTFNNKLIIKKNTIDSKEMVLDKPPFAYSATLAVDKTHQKVYITDGNAREIRRFSIQTIINAYTNNEVLSWESDGELIGEAGKFYSGGVSGITIDGKLIVGGSEGFMLPGGIQEIDPTTGEITRTWDPAQNQGYYSAFYQPANDVILAIAYNQAFLICRTGIKEECPECQPIRRTFYPAGCTICLDLFGVQVPEGTTFVWSKLGEDIRYNPRIRGIYCRKLEIWNAQPEDSGTYICTYNNGEKAIYQVTIKVIEQPVPIGTWGFLIPFGVSLSILALSFIKCSKIHTSF